MRRFFAVAAFLAVAFIGLGADSQLVHVGRQGFPITQGPPALGLYFQRDGVLDSRITYTGTNRTYEDANGDLQDASTNVARFDFSSNNNGCFSVWEARTNGIRNNTMTGASAGTPGTAPDNWAITANSVTVQLVEVGTSNGINYVDYKFSGTPSGAPDIRFETTTSINALTTETWTLSVYIALIAGDLTNINTLNLRHIERTEDGTLVQIDVGSNIKTSLTSTIQRFDYTKTLDGGGTVAHVQPYFYIGWDGSGPIDLTLRIGLPQEEQGTGASPVIKTTNAAVTATADDATMIDVTWLNPSMGTFYTRQQRPQIQTGELARIFYLISDAQANDKPIIQVWGHSGIARVEAQITPSAGNTGIVRLPTEVANTDHQFAWAYSQDDMAGSLDGGTIDTDSAFDITTGYDTFYIGRKKGGAGYWNGTICTIEYWGRRLPSLTLQDKTSFLLDSLPIYAANDNLAWRAAA